jgi:hypothetical protein
MTVTAVRLNASLNKVMPVRMPANHVWPELAGMAFKLPMSNVMTAI